VQALSWVHRVFVCPWHTQVLARRGKADALPLSVHLEALKGVPMDVHLRLMTDLDAVAERLSSKHDASR
jgi:hypothetical protein